MSMRNPYEKYRNNAIFTASGEELTLMLYDGALKFCNQAAMAIAQKDYPKSHELILKVQNIIREFQITLKPEYDVSRQLDQIYVYIHERLIQANIKKEPAVLEEISELLRDMRDTWKDAMKLAKQSPVAKAGSTAQPKQTAAKAATAEQTVAKAVSEEQAAQPVAKAVGQTVQPVAKTVQGQTSTKPTVVHGQTAQPISVQGQTTQSVARAAVAMQAVQGVPITRKAQSARKALDE